MYRIHRRSISVSIKHLILRTTLDFPKETRCELYLTIRMLNTTCKIHYFLKHLGYRPKILQNRNYHVSIFILIFTTWFIPSLLYIVIYLIYMKILLWMSYNINCTNISIYRSDSKTRFHQETFYRERCRLKKMFTTVLFVFFRMFSRFVCRFLYKFYFFKYIFCHLYVC
jgi:hypothetical protein